MRKWPLYVSLMVGPFWGTAGAEAGGVGVAANATAPAMAVASRLAESTALRPKRVTMNLPFKRDTPKTGPTGRTGVLRRELLKRTNDGDYGLFRPREGRTILRLGRRRRLPWPRGFRRLSQLQP